MIYDAADSRQKAQQIDVEPGAVAVIPFRVDCQAGKYLRAKPIENLTVEGRFVGDLAYVNLISAGLNLAAFDGERKDVQIRVTSIDTDYSVNNVVLEVKS